MNKLVFIHQNEHVAQWIERQTPTLKVRGSIPFMLNTFKWLIGADLVLTFKN